MGSQWDGSLNAMDTANFMESLLRAAGAVE
jgi:hypothetical protein